MQYEFNILHYIKIYRKRWKAIVLVVCASMLIMMLNVLLKPTVYVSTVTVLTAGGGGAAASSLGKILGLSGGGSSEGVIYSILKSRRMARDINAKFKDQRKPGYWWSINSRSISGGFAVDVRGAGPEYVKDVANFAIENLNDINEKLDVTTNKPMVKVLDAAVRGSPQAKLMSRKVLIAGIFAFLAMSLFAFFLDYVKTLKGIE